MTLQSYEKPLTANDTGETGGHQAGIHIPKSQTDLLALLPPLDPDVKNPDAWLEMADDSGTVWRFRYIYYNNSLHDSGGTRDEYRITHMTGFFRALGARAGDTLTLSGQPGAFRYTIAVRKSGPASQPVGRPIRIRLRGWQRIC
ncbi:MAG: restriction endonuclease [Sphingopyxis sp.]|nr:restriction endonuclease [Sphingopyxis sp.]